MHNRLLDCVKLLGWYVLTYIVLYPIYQPSLLVHIGGLLGIPFGVFVGAYIHRKWREASDSLPARIP
jgi:hypothetical protein